MRRKSLRLFVYGQLCFFGGVFVCILIRPIGLAVDHGVSYFGHFHQTIIPYIIAFWGSAFCLYRVAKSVTAKELRPLAVMLSGVAFFEFLLVFAPDLSHHPWVKHIHTLIGIILFIDIGAISLWLTVKLKYNLWMIFFVAIELLGGIGAIVWLMPKQGFLIQSQLLFMVGASAALIYGFQKFINKRPLVQIDN